MLNYGTSCLLINHWTLGSLSLLQLKCLLTAWGGDSVAHTPDNEKYFRIFVFCDLDEWHSGTILLAQKYLGRNGRTN